MAEFDDKLNSILSNLRETVQELHAETHRGRKDRHRADGGISGEAEERHIEAHRDEVFRDLHEERREPERETGEKELHVRQKVLRAQPQRRFFRAEETHDPHARNGLREDRCERRAAHAHAEHEHEQRVEHDVERRADRHGEHARCGKALRGDEGVEPERELHEDRAETVDRDIFERVGERCVARAEEAEDRHGEKLQSSDTKLQMRLNSS